MNRWFLFLSFAHRVTLVTRLPTWVQTEMIIRPNVQIHFNLCSSPTATMTDERPLSSESHQSTIRGKFQSNFSFLVSNNHLIYLNFVLSLRSFRHNCYASSIRNGSTSRQSERGTFGSASSDENGHVVETHRSWHVGYTAATSRQPSSVRDFPQVAHAKFQRSIAVERIYQLSATIEKRSDHHWRIFR